MKNKLDDVLGIDRDGADADARIRAKRKIFKVDIARTQKVKGYCGSNPPQQTAP
jgi:hypothetical protein